MAIELTYDENGCLPIHLAIAYGDIEGTRQLLDHGYCPNVRTKPNKPGESPIFPLCIATGNADVPMMELLLERGAVSCLNNPKCPCPHPYAKFFQYMGRLIVNSDLQTKERYANMIKRYLSNGSTVNLDFRLNDNGCTPVHYAALFNPQFLSDVLSMGYDINAQTADGDTALHMAVLNGNAWTAMTLINHGADPNIVDNEGCSSYYYARYHNMTLNQRSIGAEEISAMEKWINRIAGKEQ